MLVIICLKTQHISKERIFQIKFVKRPQNLTEIYIMQDNNNNNNKKL